MQAELNEKELQTALENGNFPFIYEIRDALMSLFSKSI
jgi:hypothetical protein